MVAFQSSGGNPLKNRLLKLPSERTRSAQTCGDKPIAPRPECSPLSRHCRRGFPFERKQVTETAIDFFLRITCNCLDDIHSAFGRRTLSQGKAPSVPVTDR